MTLDHVGLRALQSKQTCPLIRSSEIPLRAAAHLVRLLRAEDLKDLLRLLFRGFCHDGERENARRSSALPVISLPAMARDTYTWSCATRATAEFTVKVFITRKAVARQSPLPSRYIFLLY